MRAIARRTRREQAVTAGLPLTIEVAPRTSWCDNMRAVVRRKTWDGIRKAAYCASDYPCGICGAAPARATAPGNGGVVGGYGHARAARSARSGVAAPQPSHRPGTAARAAASARPPHALPSGGLIRGIGRAARRACCARCSWGTPAASTRCSRPAAHVLRRGGTSVPWGTGGARPDRQRRQRS
jgi:hypothetical protein